MLPLAPTLSKVYDMPIHHDHNIFAKSYKSFQDKDPLPKRVPILKSQLTQIIKEISNLKQGTDE